MSMSSPPQSRSVLFVCMGNICRSPAAEAVFLRALERRGLDGKLRVDSAGTIGLHAGQLPDRRMVRAAGGRGLSLQHLARPVRDSDFEEFDLIVAMDRENLADLQARLPRDMPEDKLVLFGAFSRKYPGREVPDPYYGGREGFDLVLDQLEDGCLGLIDTIFPDGRADP